MKIQIKTENEYVLDKHEIETVLKSLEYALHRITQHPTCGAIFVGQQNIENLIKDIKKDFKFSTFTGY